MYGLGWKWVLGKCTSKLDSIGTETRRSWYIWRCRCGEGEEGEGRKERGRRGEGRSKWERGEEKEERESKIAQAEDMTVDRDRHTHSYLRTTNMPSALPVQRAMCPSIPYLLRCCVADDPSEGHPVLGRGRAQQ